MVWICFLFFSFLYRKKMVTCSFFLFFFLHFFLYFWAMLLHNLIYMKNGDG